VSSLILPAVTAVMVGLLFAHPTAWAAPPERQAAPPERQIICTGPLPFSCEEVQEALLARWHLLGGVSVVRVRAEGERTWVQVGRVEREVNLEGRRGEEAARIVAVIALDLAQAGTPFAVSPPPPSSSEVSVSAAANREAPSSIARGSALRAGLLLLSPFDQSGLVARLEPTLEAGWEVVHGFGPFVTAGYRQARSADASSSLVLREVPLRAGVALRKRWLELRAGGIARPRFVEGPRSYRTISWGAAFSVAARFALTSHIALVVAAGVDLFRTRMVFAVNDGATLTTPWLVPWGGAGIVWETAL
jgi:hypothetical protein